MAKITRSIGTGMTERAVVEFDHDNPEDVAAQVNAAIRAFEISSFDRISRRLTELAVAILQAAGLPSDPAAGYMLRSTNGASFIELAEPRDVDDQANLMALDEAILAAGFEIDSAEGYAGRILRKLHLSQSRLRAGEIDDAMALAFEIGGLVTEAGMKAVFEPDFRLGEKVRAGGAKGHENAYGSPEERKTKYASYVAAFDDARTKGMDKMTAYKHAARKCGVKPRTIQRSVRNRSS
jgi:hypothetical protein